MTMRSRFGFARADLLTCLASALLIVATMITLLGAGRSLTRELMSLSNLKTLAGAHVSYANDWDGRQFTLTPENLALSNGTWPGYYTQFGVCPAPIVLGFGDTFPAGQGTGFWGFYMPGPCSSVGQADNFGLYWPIQLDSIGGGELGFGTYRLQNVDGFNSYVNGRFMDPVFFAPSDAQATAAIGPGLESSHPFTYVLADYNSTYSSYASSPAAMYHPGIFGGDGDPAFKSPFDFESASIAPTVSQCAFPDLKTRLLEYRWLQAPPMLPAISTFETALFNMGADSTPMTLFFDGHAAALSVRKVITDNDAVVRGGAPELWMDTEIPIGPWAGYEGFFSNLSIDDARTSFHVFTRGGITGRDVLTAP